MDHLDRKTSGPTYTNPVYPEYFADPFVFQHLGYYYAIGTGPLPTDLSHFQFPLLRSQDLVNWERVGAALETPVEFIGKTFWAPEVAMAEGFFYLYYSVGVGDKGHQIRVAVSDSPTGPYKDAARLTPAENPFCIDASPYQHSDGNWFLFYATDFLEGDRPGTGLVVDRLIDMTTLAGTPKVVARATSDWQRFERNRPIYNGHFDWHTLEGPSVTSRENRIFCFYSGGNWQNETYGVDYVTADHPLGPYENDTKEVPRVLRTVPEKVLGPGHNSLATAGLSETLYIIYHGWDAAQTARLMRIDPICWTDDGPRCNGPTDRERPLI